MKTQENCREATGCQGVAAAGERFTGYSALGRAAGGALALLTAGVLAHPSYPADPIAHGDAWSVLALAAGAVNAIPLVRWFLSPAGGGRDWRKLAPVAHAVVPFMVACALSITMTLDGEYRYLIGLWMCSFGVMNVTQHYVIPGGMRLLGLYYVACGVVFLLIVHVPFLNPWPVGLVFFAGEMWAAALLAANNAAGRRTRTLIQAEAN